MQYRIHTIPIWDAFAADCECPMCLIEKNLSEKSIEQYLNDAVMEPNSRIEVNKLGFCSNHFIDLFAGQNKLGLSLQVNTRTNTVIDDLNMPKNKKTAVNEAARIRNSESKCVVCKQVGESMRRYCETIGQLFANEPEFGAVLRKSKGFCLKHYADLLEHCSFSGGACEDYVKSIFLVQKAQMKRLNNELEKYSDKFDYKKSSTASTLSVPNDTLPRAINKLKGGILEV